MCRALSVVFRNCIIQWYNNLFKTFCDYKWIIVETVALFFWKPYLLQNIVRHKYENFTHLCFYFKLTKSFLLQAETQKLRINKLVLILELNFNYTTSLQLKKKKDYQRNLIHKNEKKYSAYKFEEIISLKIGDEWYPCLIYVLYVLAYTEL